MQVVSATLMIIYIAMLSCILNKIFDSLQIRTKNIKNFKILLKASGKNL